MKAIARILCALGVSTVSLSLGCDKVSWPSRNHIASLRVLGVRAEPPTLAPGKSTRLSVSCADGIHGGSSDPSCDVEVAWFAGCDNPEKNDPKKCFERYATLPDQLEPVVADTEVDRLPKGFGFGREFEFVAPDNVLSNAAKAGVNVVHFGSSYVFFAVCAGQLVTLKGLKDRLPVGCRDRHSQQLLDQSRFVVGVTTIYSYDLITSRNPELLSPEFDSVAIPESCIEAADCPANFDCSTAGECLPVVEVCSKTHQRGCKVHCLDFALAKSSFGIFGPDGSQLPTPEKSLWLDYFTNAGGLPDDPTFALLTPKDATTTERSDCIAWVPPPEATQNAHLWVVVRDNRGGLTVRDQRILVR